MNVSGTVKDKYAKLREMSPGPVLGGGLGIVFILLVGKFIKKSLYSIEDPNPNVTNFISYSINSWCWILVILLILGFFIL